MKFVETNMQHLKLNGDDHHIVLSLRHPGYVWTQLGMLSLSTYPSEITREYVGPRHKRFSLGK